MFVTGLSHRPPRPGHTPRHWNFVGLDYVKLSVSDQLMDHYLERFSRRARPLRLYDFLYSHGQLSRPDPASLRANIHLFSTLFNSRIPSPGLRHRLHKRVVLVPGRLSRRRHLKFRARSSDRWLRTRLRRRGRPNDELARLEGRLELASRLAPGEDRNSGPSSRAILAEIFGLGPRRRRQGFSGDWTSDWLWPMAGSDSLRLGFIFHFLRFYQSKFRRNFQSFRFQSLHLPYYLAGPYQARLRINLARLGSLDPGRVFVRFSFLHGLSSLSARVLGQYIRRRLQLRYRMNQVITHQLLDRLRLSLSGLRIVCKGRFERTQRAFHRIYRFGNYTPSSRVNTLDHHQCFIVTKHGCGGISVLLSLRARTELALLGRAH